MLSASTHQESLAGVERGKICSCGVSQVVSPFISLLLGAGYRYQDLLDPQHLWSDENLEYNKAVFSSREQFCSGHVSPEKSVEENKGGDFSTSEAVVSRWPLGPESQNCAWTVGAGLESFVLQKKQAQSLLAGLRHRVTLNSSSPAA